MPRPPNQTFLLGSGPHICEASILLAELFLSPVSSLNSAIQRSRLTGGPLRGTPPNPLPKFLVLWHLVSLDFSCRVPGRTGPGQLQGAPRWEAGRTGASWVSLGLGGAGRWRRIRLELSQPGPVTCGLGATLGQAPAPPSLEI